MKKIWNSILVLAATGVLVLACSKNKDDDTPPEETNTLEITSFAPLTQEVGKTVTITGKNFATTTSGNVVQFNGVNASLNSATANQLVAVVPTGDVDGKITVTVGTETATSAQDFTFKEPEEQLADVYVAGYGYSDGTSVAILWEDYEPVVLTNGQHSAQAHDVAVRSDGKAVIVGQEKFSTVNTAMLWVKGEDPVKLSDGESDAVATSIAISGNEVYVSGYEREGEEYVAKVWNTGGEIASYPHPYGDSYAESIAVDGEDIFVAGSVYEPEGGYQYPQLWKNGEPQYLDLLSSDGQAHAVHVNGTKVYVAGYEFNLDPYNYVVRAWENGDIILSSNPENQAYGYSIFATYDNVFVAGRENNVATLWTNGEAKALSGGTFAHSVTFEDGDVYAAGRGPNEDATVGKVWINDEEPIMLSGGDGNCFAHAIVIR